MAPVEARQVIYKNERYLFTVSEEAGSLVLQVLCGGHGAYLKEHWLTAEEESMFRFDPESISPLARELCELCELCEQAPEK